MSLEKFKWIVLGMMLGALCALLGIYLGAEKTEPLSFAETMPGYMQVSQHQAEIDYGDVSPPAAGNNRREPAGSIFARGYLVACSTTTVAVVGYLAWVVYKTKKKG